ncbi:hypothetical protein [Prevotella sp. KH2C16]|uniref:hypothetical protein n=1 Tax=Prevotella sp. KH2C16 TaxID=1855325 RepID=UPI0008E1EAE6|nr:hypothetical protein [Prevotella sp. KH2C16]SFG05491.1 hypothetical protein SAMN05216383_104119 [Prevotella sp. KH2C16]
MKTKTIKTKALMLLCGALLTFGFTACSDDPQKPVDETKNKLHEDPAKVELILVDCHLHAQWGDIQEHGGPHQNPDTEAKHIKSVQKIIWQLNPATKKWEFGNEGQKKFYVQKAPWYDGRPAPIYLLFIKYYNAAGKEITDQFQTEDQRKIHQHFFMAENVKTLPRGKEEVDDQQTQKLFDYLYCDTDPWNKTTKEGAKLIGKKSPTGFKGVLRFLKTRKEFDMRIKLYHGYKSKFLDGDKTSPYYAPDNRLYQNGTFDIDYTIPFVIYMDRDDTSNMDPTIDEDTDLSTISEGKLDDASNNLIYNLMDAFNLKWQEALEEYVNFVYKKKGHSEEGYWL